LTAPPVDTKDAEAQEAESGMALPFVIYLLMFFFHGRKSRKNTDLLRYNTSVLKVLKPAIPPTYQYF
jgi:hypothetical protein